MLNKDIYDLEISNIQAKILLENFRGNNSDGLKVKIEKAVDDICLKLYINDNPSNTQWENKFKELLDK